MYEDLCLYSGHRYFLGIQYHQSDATWLATTDTHNVQVVPSAANRSDSNYYRMISSSTRSFQVNRGYAATPAFAELDQQILLL